MGFHPALSISALSWTSINFLTKLINPKNSKAAFQSVDELIVADGTLSPTRKGTLQGTIKGADVEKVFEGLSKGGQKLSSGAVKNFLMVQQ